MKNFEPAPKTNEEKAILLEKREKEKRIYAVELGRQIKRIDAQLAKLLK